MEAEADLESKYKKLALEYSKIRSQASVLKKAVLEEQQKNLQLKGLIQQQEQKIRKHDQEMESVIFRNDQLTKRVTVLQEELKGCRCAKKSKKPIANDDGLVVRDEELYKRTEENAKLVSSMADKDLEIMAYKEKVGMLEEKIKTLDKAVTEVEDKYKGEIGQLKSENQLLKQSQETIIKTDTVQPSENGINNQYWEKEAKHWQTEYELLRSKPQTDEELNDYYESKVKELTDIKELAQSEAKSLWAENSNLEARLEQVTLELQRLQSNSDQNLEELRTTRENYKVQLDAMTEHLAAQNEKITKQCDDIQVLKHKLTLRK